LFFWSFGLFLRGDKLNGRNWCPRKRENEKGKNTLAKLVKFGKTNYVGKKKINEFLFLNR
jgi:hypothetical protein